MKLLSAAALALSCGLWLAFADDKNPAQVKAERATKFAELKKDYDAAFKELEERFARVTVAQDKRGIRVEMREGAQLMSAKVIKIVELDPKDEIGFEASAFIVRSSGIAGAGGPDVEKAAGFLAEHHSADERLQRLLVFAMLVGKPGEKLLKAASEKGNSDTKAVALALRGTRAIDYIDDEDDDETILAAVREATALLGAAKKTAPDAKIDDTTPVTKIVDLGTARLKSITALMPGNPAPKVESKTLDDKKASLADHKGKVVVLDFWSTRCEPCKMMIPHQRELVAKYKDKPFVLVSSSGDPDKRTLQNFLQKTDMPWVHWWDGEYPVEEAFRAVATPTVYLIDHEGVIRYRASKQINEKQLDKFIDELVKAAEKAKG